MKKEQTISRVLGVCTILLGMNFVIMIPIILRYKNPNEYVMSILYEARPLILAGLLFVMTRERK